MGTEETEAKKREEEGRDLMNQGELTREVVSFRLQVKAKRGRGEGKERKEKREDQEAFFPFGREREKG